MVTYIVRRLLGAIVLLFIVSIARSAILLPGATSGRVDSGDPGHPVRRPYRDAGDGHLIAHKLGFYDPVCVQYGNWVKGIFVGGDYDNGAGVEHCPAPCLGYSFNTEQPVCPELLDRLPVTLSLAIGAAILWVVFGVSTGVISALRRGSVLDRAAMTGALAGVSLPIFFTGLLVLSIFIYWLGWTRRAAATPRSPRIPADWFVRPDPALDHARVPVRRRRTRD